MGTKRKLWLTGVWVAGFCIAVSGAKLPLTTNGIDWGTNYYNPDKRSGVEYDGLPMSASPAWVSGYNTGSYSLEDNYLRIVTKSSRSEEAETRQTFSITAGWNLTDDAVVEATLRVVENIDGLPAAGAQQICYGNLEIRSFIGFTKDGIRTSGGTYYQHDMTEWTTVRLVFENIKNPALAAVNVYVNGGTEPVLINKTWYPSSAALNVLRIGDMNAVSGGTVDWESIRWKCNAASDGVSGGMVVQLVEKKMHAAVKPADRADRDWWIPRHEEKLAEIKSRDVDLVFIGDSITQGWENAGKPVWDEYFAPRNAVNLGFGGDRTEQVLWRIDHGELDGINPKAVMIMIGTNNSGRDSAEEIADGIKAIVTRIRHKLPKTKTLVLAIFPRGDAAQRADTANDATYNDQWAKNDQTSEIVSTIANNKNIFFLNINQAFLDADGVLRRSVMPDLLHLNASSYRIWAEQVEPMISQLMAE
ncbi:MAG: platelet-activating factor acetylhydrolase IB subunit [Kiritimatiellales bacterium]